MPILPDFAAAEFESGTPVDNPFFPLEAGAIRSYGGSKLASPAPAGDAPAPSCRCGMTGTR